MYRSLLPLAVPLRGLLTLCAWLMAVFAVVHGLRLAVTFTSSPWPGGRPEDLWDRAGAAAGAVAVGSLVSVAATAALFMAWGLRAYRNLPALGIENRRYWTVWLVAGWIIPGANLFVPKLLMADVWRASSPTLPPFPGRSWLRRPVGDVVNRWWALWLTGPAVAVVVASLVARSPDGVGVVRAWEAAALVAGLALAGSARAARQMVGIITVAQARRSELVAWAEDPRWSRSRAGRNGRLAPA